MKNSTCHPSDILVRFPPMGIYEVLFSFLDACGVYMGEPNTHPWAQGFPLTTQLPGGPEIPASVSFASSDLKYPAATGTEPLLRAIANYYRQFYGANITAKNVAVFAGGRPGIFAIVAFLSKEYRIFIEETEYTPYYDLLKILQREYTVIHSDESNRFRPSLESYAAAVAANDQSSGQFFIKSNPCNPTGVAWRGEKLQAFVDYCSQEWRGAIIDEAYELFQTGEPESALRYIPDIESTNLFVVGAATKGLQVPGARIGWVVAAERNIELFRNYSSIAMGGVSRLSQILVTQLLELERMQKARQAVSRFYSSQRQRYREGLESLGLKLYTGEGGFYHWGRLPGELTAGEFNQRLFARRAAILPGTLCDMLRRGDSGPHAKLFRFSFGPLTADSYESDMRIVAECLEAV